MQSETIDQIGTIFVNYSYSYLIQRMAIVQAIAIIAHVNKRLRLVTELTDWSLFPQKRDILVTKTYRVKLEINRNFINDKNRRSVYRITAYLTCILITVDRTDQIGWPSAISRQFCINLIFLLICELLRCPVPQDHEAMHLEM